MGFDFEDLRGPCCRLMSIGFLICVRGLIEHREIVGVPSGLTISCGLEAFVDPLLGPEICEGVSHRGLYLFDFYIG